jgi:hypothetical protein
VKSLAVQCVFGTTKNYLPATNVRVSIQHHIIGTLIRFVVAFIFVLFDFINHIVYICSASSARVHMVAMVWDSSVS